MMQQVREAGGGEAQRAQGVQENARSTGQPSRPARQAMGPFVYQADVVTPGDECDGERP